MTARLGIELTGRRFGQLEVVQRKRVGSLWYWVCHCDCGAQKDIRTGNLTGGSARSCGNRKVHRRQPIQESLIGRCILSYRTNARASGRAFDLDRSYFAQLIKENCAYCATPPRDERWFHGWPEPLVCNGIDRVVNEIGYVKGNVVPCCALCNRMKGTMEAAKFREQAALIARNQQ